jgi:hypothetical protein
MTPENIQAALDAARAIERPLADARWALESALSAQRKAQPSTGYRSTAKLGDAPWDTSKADADVVTAYEALQKALEQAFYAADAAFPHWPS